MAAISSPTTRILALAVIALAAGLFSLRAYSVFTAPAPIETGSNPVEAKLTQLLIPIIGSEQIQVSVRRSAESGTAYLILHDESASPDQGLVETVLAAAAGYQAGSDTLTFVPTSYANVAGNPSQMQMLELTGLGLLLAFLVFQVRPVAAAAESRLQVKPTAPRDLQAATRSATPVAEPSTAHKVAADLAAGAPDQTVTLIRKWMNTDQERTG